MMDNMEAINLKKSMLEDNDMDAEKLRQELKACGVFYINLMSSPGSGKTTLLVKTGKVLSQKLRIGVMEADIDSNVDAQTMTDNGIQAVQLHTGGMCHLDAEMSRQGIRALGCDQLDIVVLENVGNLVCPAEFDTGAHLNVVILSISEGDDKPLKYPLMFEKADVVLISKMDAKTAFDFDMQTFEKNVHLRHPGIPVFAVSSKTGEGMDAWIDWLLGQYETTMGKIKCIEVHQSVFAENDRIASQIREKNRAEKTFMVNLMASPGAGKTTTLLRTIDLLSDQYQIGVMEADIDTAIDAEKIEASGTRVIQVHTGGQCAMDAQMTQKALESIRTSDLDLLFLENVGNLVCTAEEDTGASINVEILSVPEGDDKPLKYPLMFEVCQAVLVNKIDTREFFSFDDETFAERIQKLNPGAKVFFLSAKTGEGFSQWTDWLQGQIKAWNG